MYKICTICKSNKPVFEFHRKSESKDGYSTRCKLCKKSVDYSQYMQTRESRLDYQKKYQENNNQKITRYLKSWYKLNKVKALALSNKRRARKISATPKWLTTDDFKLMEIEYALSKWCSSVMGEQYEVDHIVPLQGKNVCGLHVPWNLQVLPKRLNRLKSNRLIE
jgi:hypothetical protein